jgi:hypothetical protein
MKIGQTVWIAPQEYCGVQEVQVISFDHDVAYVVPPPGETLCWQGPGLGAQGIFAPRHFLYGTKEAAEKGDPRDVT